MFDNHDAEHLAGIDKRIPDGIIDGTQYAEIFSNLVEYMKKINPESYLSNITWIMSAMNECYSPVDNGSDSGIDKTRATDTITALSYFVMTLIAILDKEDFDEYIRIQVEEIIPDLKTNAETIPYYNVEDEVKEIMEFMDSINDIDDIGDLSD